MYRITINQDIGGECFNSPMMTLETQADALERFDEACNALKEEFDHAHYRIVGANAQIILKKVPHLFDEGEIIRFARIKRPLNSPCAVLTVTDH